MTGYHHLLGQKVRGRWLDIHNKWARFDGNVPLVDASFTGTRISLVFFTRKDWLNMEPEVKQQLEGIGMPLPDESWMAKDTSNVQDVRTAAQPPRSLNDGGQPEPEDTDEEVDENVSAHLEGREKAVWSWSQTLGRGGGEVAAADGEWRAPTLDGDYCRWSLLHDLQLCCSREPFAI